MVTSWIARYGTVTSLTAPCTTSASVYAVTRGRSCVVHTRAAPNAPAAPMPQPHHGVLGHRDVHDHEHAQRPSRSSPG